MNEKQTKGNILIKIKKKLKWFRKKQNKREKKGKHLMKTLERKLKRKTKKKKKPEEKRKTQWRGKILPEKKTRNQMKEQRAARTSEAENAIQTFLQMIKQEPTYIWSVCHRLMYRECVVMYNVNVF